MAILGLALSGPLAGKDAALTAVVTWVEGDVEILGNGANRGAIAVRDQIVPSGTTLKIPAGHLAVLVCSSQQIFRLAGPQTWRVSPESCAKGRPLNTAEYTSLVPKAGRHEVVRGLMVLERDARGDNDTDPLAPVVLSPRNTLVRSPRPAVIWIQVPTATEYQVVWTGRGVGGSPLQLDADQVRCTAGPGGAKVCSLPWPADRPDLPPGSTFFLSVAARDGVVAPWHTSPDATVRTQELGAARDLENRLRALEDLGLGGAALDAARGGLLADGGLYADAAESYQKALAAAPSPALRVTLADIYFVTSLYRLAAPLYRQAQADGGPAVRAAAAFGLGRLEYSSGHFSDAAQFLTEAQQLYGKQGLEEETKAAGTAAKQAKERSPAPPHREL